MPSIENSPMKKILFTPCTCITIYAVTWSKAFFLVKPKPSNNVSADWPKVKSFFICCPHNTFCFLRFFVGLEFAKQSFPQRCFNRPHPQKTMTHSQEENNKPRFSIINYHPKRQRPREMRQ